MSRKRNGVVGDWGEAGLRVRGRAWGGGLLLVQGVWGLIYSLLRSLATPVLTQ